MRQTKRTLVFLFAILLVIVGLIGIVLPIIPGAIFIALAIVIFSLFFPALGEKTKHYTRRFPKVQEAIGRMEEWVRRSIGEL